MSWWSYMGPHVKHLWLEDEQVSLSDADILGPYKHSLILETRTSPICVRRSHTINCLWICCTVPVMSVNMRLFASMFFFLKNDMAKYLRQ